MKSLEELDRWIAGKVKRLSSNVAGTPQKKELLEIRRDILEDVRDQIEPKGSGKYLFPHTEIAVRVAARDEAERPLLEAAFVLNGALEEDVRALLVEAGCPAQVAVKVEIVIDQAEQLFQIAYSSASRKFRRRRSQPRGHSPD